MPNGTVQEWETNWREKVDAKLEELLSELKGLVSRMAVNEQATKDLREKPGNIRNWSMLWLMIGGLAMSTLFGCSGLVISLVSLIVTHWH